MRSYIVRVYRDLKDDDDLAQMIGVVENSRNEQRSFRGFAELLRILQEGRKDEDIFAPPK